MNIHPSIFRGEHLDRVAFPLGGIGAGMISLEGTGALSQVSLRHKPNSFARGKLVRLVSMITIAALSSASADVVVKPGDNLSAAITKVQPGDALVLEPGVYYQAISLQDVAGTAESPITIKARIPGSVTTVKWK